MLLLYTIYLHISLCMYTFPSEATEEGEKIMKGVVGYLYSTQLEFRTMFGFHVLDLILILIRGLSAKIWQYGEVVFVCLLVFVCMCVCVCVFFIRQYQILSWKYSQKLMEFLFNKSLCDTLGQLGYQIWGLFLQPSKLSSTALAHGKAVVLGTVEDNTYDKYLFMLETIVDSGKG